MKALTILFAVLTLNSTAMACPGENYTWLDITVSGDGRVTHHFEPQNPADETIHDVFQLRYVGESVTIHAGTGLEGSSHTITVEIIDQSADIYFVGDQRFTGVLGNIYKITKASTAVYPDAITKKTVEFASVTTNYKGNGLMTRGCGEVQTSTDPSKLSLPRPAKTQTQAE